MITGKYYVYILCILTFICTSLQAQEYEFYTIEPEAETDYLYELLNDTVKVSFDDNDPEKIYDIQYQLKRQNNRDYYKPAPPTKEMREAMEKREYGLSEEALQITRRRLHPSQYLRSNLTFKDTVIFDPLLLPPLFKREYLAKEPRFEEKELPGLEKQKPVFETDTTLFLEEKRKKEIRKKRFNYITLHYPQYFKYTEQDLPADRIEIDIIKKEPIRDLTFNIKPETEVVEIAPPAKFIPDRLYWTSHFESAVQFAQNYVSPNWHQGGSSNLNIFTKNYIRYDYKRDKVQWVNELEDKISLYNASQDTLHRYKVGEDMFRIHSNMGYSAFNKWYYTLDAEFRTQLLRSYAENQDLQLAGFLAPYSLNIGLGMKYELHKQFKQKGRKLDVDVNIAPASYSYMYSRKKDIDLGRHGFQKYEDSDVFKNYKSEIGSTLRANMTVVFNPNISWQSRIFYFTTYEKAIAEFENTVIFAVTRHLSTRFWFHMRFDDSVTKNEDFDSYFQINELFSFGFNYKW